MDILIIIDMQEAPFLNSDKYDAENVIDRINQLSDHTRLQGGKVIFIQHDGIDAEGLSPSTPGWEILSALHKSETDIVLRKTINDAFSNPRLRQILESLSADKIIISGWATDFCVDTTVRSAVTAGYNTVVISDCHTVSDRPHLRASQVIEHHNWICQNLITTENSIEVTSLKEWCDGQKNNSLTG